MVFAGFGHGAIRAVRHRRLAPVPSITKLNRSHVIDSNVSLEVAILFGDHGSMIAKPYHLYIERADPAKNMARYY
ncbi:hypothetical protein ACC739_37405, partial [Rhizobium ruizarguesonis]